MKRLFERISSNVDFIADNENDRMSGDQLNTFLEIIHSPVALKVARNHFGSERAVRTLSFIQGVERAVRAGLFTGGAPQGEEDFIRILQQVSEKPSEKPGT